MNRYEAILEQQLAVDYNCTVDDVRSSSNIFRSMCDREGRRINGSEGAILRVAVYRNKLLIMASEAMLPWCIDRFGSRQGTWFSEPENLLAIDAGLRKHGQKLADAHHHYIPEEKWPLTPERFPVRWYQQEELDQFRGDSRFWEALMFDPARPDLLAVCAMDGEHILGMAAVTRNSPMMWEIGVNVTEAGRGKGVGSYVTALMKEKVLSMGAMPTYATVESHIASQKVAFRAGFVPAFYELYSSK